MFDLPDHLCFNVTLVFRQVSGSLSKAGFFLLFTCVHSGVVKTVAAAVTYMMFIS